MTDTPFTPALDHEESIMLTKEERAELRRRWSPGRILVSPRNGLRLLDALDQAERKMLNYARKAGRLEQDLMNCRMEAEQRIAELESKKAAQIREIKPPKSRDKPRVGGRALSMRQLRDKLPVGRTTIYRWIEKSGFPPGIKIGRNRTVWIEAEVDQWIEQRRSEEIEPAGDGAPGHM